MKKGKWIGIMFVFLSFMIYADRAEATESGTHEYSDWIVTKEPTCVEKGERYKECLLHGGRTIEELPMADHQYEVREIAPTCMEDGKNIVTCKVCGKTYEEPAGEALGHDYQQKEVQEPVCGQQGVRTFACTRCENQYTETIPELPHEYGEWIVQQEPAEGIAGKQYKACTFCGDRIYEDIAALAIIEEKSEPAVTLTDLFFVSLDLVILAVFAFFIQMDVRLMIWAGKKRKKYEAEQKKIRKFGDGFGFH